MGSAEERLERFIARYSPEVGAVARTALATMRARLPGAFQFVYDNYNALVIGFGPTERSSDAVFSIALYPRWVNPQAGRSGAPRRAGGAGADRSGA